MSSWFNKGSGTVLKFGGRNLTNIADNTFRFRFSDTSFDPSSITPLSGSCASSYTWTSLGNGVWDCLLTKKYNHRTSLYQAFVSVFHPEKLGTVLADLIQTCDTSNITTTYGMFSGCTNLRSTVLFDTRNVVTMYWMFKECSNLVTVPLFNTSKVTNMSSMFGDCSNLSSVPPFDTSKVTIMSSMFSHCTSLTSVPLFNTSKVTTMDYMFSSCSSLTALPLFDTSSVTIMQSMLFSCNSLKTIPLFNTASVTNMNSFAKWCYYVESGALALYQQASSQANPPSDYTDCFTNCGANTSTGAAELAQIPSSWGGTGA